MKGEGALVAEGKENVGTRAVRREVREGSCRGEGLHGGEGGKKREGKGGKEYVTIMEDKWRILSGACDIPSCS